MTNEDCEAVLKMIIEEYNSDITSIKQLMLNNEQIKNISVGKLRERISALEHVLKLIRR